MLNIVNTLVLSGLKGEVCKVEACLYQGLNRFIIVGLPDRSVSEARERILAAVLNKNLDFPIGQLIVNLYPAAIEKRGTAFDLPICLSILLSGEIPLHEVKLDLDKTIVVGELALSGEIMPVSQAGAIVISAKELGFKNIVLPSANYAQNPLCEGHKAVSCG